MEKYTIDELLDVLQWARDRAAYFRACNKPMPGALYAADCKAERDAEAELYRRGYYTAWDGIASPSRHKQKEHTTIAGRAKKPIEWRWRRKNMEGVKYMKRYYIEKSKMDNFLKEITAAQQKTNIFANVSVKPYRGKKYDPRNTVVVVVG